MPKPHRPASPLPGVLLLGAVAAACVVAAALSPWDHASTAVVLVAVLAAGVAVLALRREREVDPVPEPAAPPQPSPAQPNLLSALDVHPDPLAVIEAGEDGPRVAYANYAARDLLHLRAETNLVAALRHPRVLDRVDRALAEGAAGNASYQPAGDERTWRIATVPMPSGGAPSRALMAFRDDTAVRASQRLGADFLANASHELRTPLASLAGFIETLQGPARDDAEARERFLGIMAAQAGRMSRLVDDLLSLSRIEMNEHVPPRGSVELALAVRDVLDALAPVAEAQDVRVEADLPAAGETTLEGDRDQIVQVVQNLIDNALKYTPAGGAASVVVRACEDAAWQDPVQSGAARLALVTPARPTTGPTVVLRVRDWGQGIPREHLPRLGERFYRVDEGGRRGTGLGLAIVRHVVNRHRGTLLVESLPGAGTTFTVALPRRLS